MQIYKYDIYIYTCIYIYIYIYIYITHPSTHLSIYLRHGVDSLCWLSSVSPEKRHTHTKKKKHHRNRLCDYYASTSLADGLNPMFLMT